MPGRRARVRGRPGQGRGNTTGDAAAEKGIGLGDLVRLCEARAVDPTTLFVFHAEANRRGFDPQTGQGGSFPDYTYGTHAAEVEVDLETGEVEVLKYAACHDVGRRSTRSGSRARSREGRCRASATP